MIRMLSSKENTVEGRRRNLFGLLSDTFSRRMKLKLSNYSFAESILLPLLEGDRLCSQEDWLWDYKKCLPSRPASYSRGTPEYKQYNAELCEIIKDIAAFHNTAGGVLIFGVDNDGTIVSCNAPDTKFVDDLGRKVRSKLNSSIDFQFMRTTFNTSVIYLLIVPRRKTAQPLSFQKQADSTVQQSGGGPSFAFKQNDTYFRKEDDCVPATKIVDAVERHQFYSGSIEISGIKLGSLNELNQRKLARYAIALGSIFIATIFLMTFYSNIDRIHIHLPRCELSDDRLTAILSGHSSDFKFIQAAKDHICSIHIASPNLTNQELTSFVLNFRDKWESIISNDIDRIEKTHSVSLAIIRSALANGGFEEADGQLQSLENMSRDEATDSISYLSDLHLLRASLALHINNDLDKAVRHYKVAAEYFDGVDDRKAFSILMEAALRILRNNQVFPGDGAIIAEEIIRQSIERWPNRVDVPALAGATSLLGSALAERGDDESLELSIGIFDFALHRMRKGSVGRNLTRVNLIKAMLRLKERLRRNADSQGVDEVNSRLRRAGAFESGTLESAVRLMNGELYNEWVNSEYQNSTDGTWSQFKSITVQYLEGLDLVLEIYRKHGFDIGVSGALNNLGLANYRLAYRGARSRSGLSREQRSVYLEKAVDAFQSAIAMAGTVYGDTEPVLHLVLPVENLCLARIEQGWWLDEEDAREFYRDVAVPTCERAEEVGRRWLQPGRPEPWVFMYIRLAKIELDWWSKDRSQAVALKRAMAASSLAAKHGVGVVGTAARLFHCIALVEQKGVALWPVTDFESLSELRDHRVRSNLLEFEACQGLLDASENVLQRHSHAGQPR